MGGVGVVVVVERRPARVHVCWVMQPSRPASERGAGERARSDSELEGAGRVEEPGRS